MKTPAITVGSWLLLPEGRIKSRRGHTRLQRFSPKEGRRPVVVAAGGPAQGFTAFPRSTATPHVPGAARRHERHHHRRTHPACCIDQDGWIVNFPVGLQLPDLLNRRVRCQEPDNTGLVEQIERWTQT